jgi:hypothetical protein
MDDERRAITTWLSTTAYPREHVADEALLAVTSSLRRWLTDSRLTPRSSVLIFIT